MAKQTGWKRNWALYLFLAVVGVLFVGLAPSLPQKG